MRKLEQQFNQLQRIVLALSGAHKEVLEWVPSERARFESLGWAILITSGVATVSMWFALSSAVGINGILALPVALAWGLVIMGIDRWLIVSMPIEGRRKFAIALPRLALAVLLGTLISTPLVLRIFESEINAQIAKMQQQNYSTFLQQQQASDVAKQVGTYSSELHYVNNVIATHGAATVNTGSDPQLTAYNTQLSNLNTELTHWTNLKNQYYTDYICQLYGGPTCPKKGFGPAAKDSQANYQAASQEVDTLKGQINQVQAEIQQRDAQLTSNSAADQQARYEQALTEQPIVKNEYDTALQRQNQLQASFFASNQASHGILIRLEALSDLSNGNFTVTAARFLLFLLFLVIECLPVTVKLLQRPGLYEEALQHAREGERRDFKKYFSFRSRFVGPNGMALLQPAPWVEMERRVEANWTPTKALPGVVIHDDDEPTELADDPDSWTLGDGRVGRGSADRRPGSERPEQWHGRDRWLNHWRHRPAEDDEPPAKAAPQDMYGMGGPESDQDDMGAEHGQMGEAPLSGDWPGYGEVQEEFYGDQPYSVQVHQEENSRGATYDTGGYRVHAPDSDAEGRQAWDVWHDEAPSEPPSSPAPTASPGRGGTPLSWDEDDL